jgi:hypothetical protein
MEQAPNLMDVEKGNIMKVAEGCMEKCLQVYNELKIN